MVPVDENEMSWVVGVDGKKGAHMEETIDEEVNPAQTGEHVAAKINDDHKRMKRGLAFMFLGIVIGCIVAAVILTGGSSSKKIICDRVDDVKLDTIKQEMNATVTLKDLVYGQPYNMESVAQAPYHVYQNDGSVLSLKQKILRGITPKTVLEWTLGTSFILRKGKCGIENTLSFESIKYRNYYLSIK